MNEQYGEPSRGPFAIRNELREIHRKLDKVCGPEHWESKLITPDNCGCSQLACNIVNNTFLSLDGFEAMRKQMAGTDYTDEQFGAELARIVDRELKAATSELGNTGCDKCGMNDRADGSELCVACLDDATLSTDQLRSMLANHDEFELAIVGRKYAEIRTQLAEMGYPVDIQVVMAVVDQMASQDQYFVRLAKVILATSPVDVDVADGYAGAGHHDHHQD